MASIKKLTKDKKTVLIMVLVKIKSRSHGSCSGLRIVSGLAESLSSGGPAPSAVHQLKQTQLPTSSFTGNRKSKLGLYPFNHQSTLEWLLFKRCFT